MLIDIAISIILNGLFWGIVLLLLAPLIVFIGIVLWAIVEHIAFKLGV